MCAHRDVRMFVSLWRTCTLVFIHVCAYLCHIYACVCQAQVFVFACRHLTRHNVSVSACMYDERVGVCHVVFMCVCENMRVCVCMCFLYVQLHLCEHVALSVFARVRDRAGHVHAHLHACLCVTTSVCMHAFMHSYYVCTFMFRYL